MDNLTHSFVGLAAAKAGLERLSPGATVVCILSANAPDIDILTLVFGDRWTYLHNHRGITHSLVGTLFLALALPLVFYITDRLLARFRNQTPRIKLGGLFAVSLIVSATHPFMDWTNNYGIRPLLPWNSKWFYGDFVFIVDPFIWLLMGGTAFLLTSNTKKQLAFWIVLGSILTSVVLFASGRQVLESGWIRAVWIIAIAVLIILRVQAVKRWQDTFRFLGFALLSLYWCGLWGLHTFAYREAQRDAATIARDNQESILSMAAMPTLANPFHWQVVFSTEKAAYRFELFLLREGEHNAVRFERPEAINSVPASKALEDYRAKVFMEFARFPVIQIEDNNCTKQTLVQLADLRYTEPGSRRGTFALEIPVECPPQNAAEDH